MAGEVMSFAARALALLFEGRLCSYLQEDCCVLDRVKTHKDIEDGLLLTLPTI